MTLSRVEFMEKTVYCLAGKELEIWVCPEDGMNVYQVIYKGTKVIIWDDKRFQDQATYGIPILYPTPNRTRDLKLHIGADAYDARMHGLVRMLPFEVTGERMEEDCGEITGTLVWDETQPDFSMFPYRSELRVTAGIDGSEFIWSYELVNKEDKPLPYGIAIHPFFDKNGQRVKIKVPADSLMEMTEEKLPTGKLIPIEETKNDLRTMSEVEELSLDHVYTDYHAGESIEICYPDFRMAIDCTDDFSHVVVFTPDAPFFCIENQSCSTDCYNLYEAGFQKESGLEFAEAGKSACGRLTFRFFS